MRAFGQIGVVHQEHVARLHGVGRKVAHHRVRHRRIGATGELAAIAVEQADAIVVRLADHRRARGALDGVFDLGLDRVQRALDDLQARSDRRRGARPGAVGQRCLDVAEAHVHARRRCGSQRMTRMPCGRRPVSGRGTPPWSSRTPRRPPGPRAVNPAAGWRGRRPACRGTRRRNRPAACPSASAPRRSASFGMLGPLDQAEAGDAEIDQLDLLLAGVIVAEGAQMRGVEGVDQAARGTWRRSRRPAPARALPSTGRRSARRPRAPAGCASGRCRRARASRPPPAPAPA